MMRKAMIRIAPFVLVSSLLLRDAPSAAEVRQEAPAKPPVAIAVGVWDSGQPSAETLSSATLGAKKGWSAVGAQEKPASFKGDAVLTNGRQLAVVRKQAPAVEVYAQGAEGLVARLRVQLVSSSGEPAERLERLAVVENTKGAATLEASYTTAKGTEVTARFRLKRGDVAMQVEPGTGAGRMRIECQSRFVVLPDFFADDILIDARTIPPDTAELPSENFLMHLVGNGEAIAMCVFENRQQDTKVSLSGSGERRHITASEIGFEGKKVWVSVLEGPQVWHQRDLSAADAGKIIPLDWKMPFPGQWRVDFMRTNGLTDSWEMLLPMEKGMGYIKPSWLGSEMDEVGANRSRWNTVLGRYPYPCWSDADGRGHIQPLKSRVLQFDGPMVVYPINRVKQTPLDAYSVIDVMRNTLGVGPCQYILDLEGQKSEYRGRATCSCRDELARIYGSKEQKQKRAEVEKILDDGLIFVKHIRGRITRYVEFGHKMREYLAAQKTAHPELADFLTEMDQIAAEIDKRVAARADKIKTPEHVAAMNEDFRKNVLDDNGPEARTKSRQYAEALVVIGDNQDELSGECRWVVKALRQKAGILLATNPRAAPVAAEIRARTQQALRNPANHEGAHH
jgi:hypothetical protein